MKLLRASFENFRLLKDLRLEFATEEDRNLTVIRAANETGKTTILTALQWGMYGDDALPDKGKGFRLHPIDVDTNQEGRIPITVTIDFEVTKVRRSSERTFETKKYYRIVRTAYESITASGADRSSSTVKLFALTEEGAEPISNPESLIDEELPQDLRDVFFTDGDRALSFIESTVATSVKRDRVSRAIRSLLGLGVLEKALSHVKKTSSEINKQAKNVGANGDLDKIATELENLDNDIEKERENYQDAKVQFEAFDEKFAEIEKQIEETLRSGDREELASQKAAAERNIRRIDQELENAKKQHLELFKSQALGRDLLAPVLRHGFKKLDELHDRGEIPSTTIPVLEDRLNYTTCFCGESLDPNDPKGKERRDHIAKLIDDSQKADEVRRITTDLFYSSRPLNPDIASEDQSWINEYSKVVQHRDGLQSQRDEQGKKLKKLEKQINELPDTDIQGLRQQKQYYREQRDRFNSLKSQHETKIQNLSDERSRKEQERNNLLTKQRRGAKVLAQLEVAQDVTSVLESAYERITNQELQKVSDLMNEIFLEMIGSDPEQKSIIREAAISSDFDIVVYGPNRRTLNPDRDLNGASRRALTLAFILALTKVSEVEAPNVIDTPLGMMSGYVKRSVLQKVIAESSQLVLLLTRSEIAECEDIIDKAAGKVITLSNPAHYPRMLANDPGVSERMVLRCDCDHRSQCTLCQRREDENTPYEIAS